MFVHPANILIGFASSKPEADIEVTITEACLERVKLEV
jgi:hypothetical protein